MIRDIALAVDLARRAGDEIMRVYASDFHVEEKDDDEGPVTAADRAADRLIRDGLAAAFPGDAILSEETPDDPARLSARRLWLVDPLDGTRQFVHHIDEFAVMIGLAIEGRAVLGVVHLPAERRTLYGAPGAGCWLADGDAAPRALQLPATPDLPGRLSVAVSRMHLGPRTRGLLERVGATATLRSGSVGRKAALVLLGEADAYVGLGRRSRHWDACAPDALLRAAGGEFRDARGRPVVYNTEATRNRAGLLACRAGLVERFAAAAAAVLPPEEP